MGYRNYAPLNGFLVNPDGTGDFTTIGAALAVAPSGKSIYISPGTYTENLNLVPGVNLVTWPAVGEFAATTLGGVIINGKCTLNTPGVVSIYGITLQTNLDFAIQVTGSTASKLILNGCFLNCTNHTGLNFSSSSASSTVVFDNCSGDLANLGYALFAHSSAGSLYFDNSIFQNSSGSITSNTVSSTGYFYPNLSGWGNPITFSSSGSIQGNLLNIIMTGSNVTALVFTGSSVNNIQNGTIGTNTATAISIGAGCTLQIHHFLISSSNGTTISGAGTLEFTNITFNSVANLAGTLTISNNAMNTFLSGASAGTAGQVWTSNGPSSPNTWSNPSGGAIVKIFSQTASNSATIDFNSTYITATYNNYMIVFTGVRPATGSTSFQLLLSTNNGAGYLNSGFLSNFNFIAGASLSEASSTANFQLSNSIDSNTSATLTASGVIYLQNLTSGATPSITGNITYLNSSAVTTQGMPFGYGPTSITVNNIRFMYSAGNITSGTFTVYGIT